MYDQGLQDIFDTGKHNTLPKGQVLRLSDDRMLLNSVITGYIKRYSITNDGSQSIQSIYGPGNIFPLTPVFRVLYDMEIYHGQEVYYYETMTPVALHSIDRTTLIEALQNNPLIYSDLFKLAGKRLNSNIQRLENMSLRAANRRVAHQLVHYCDVFGKDTPEGIEIQLPLTHQNLADMLNLARETVTHSISSLQEKGLIKSDKNIIVSDVAKLKREVR